MTPYRWGALLAILAADVVLFSLVVVALAWVVR